jgi:SAM-dependent methyltransferase
MNDPGNDTVFAGAVPTVYDTFLVPLIFEAYAEDLAGRVAARSPRRVLEVAAGTGVVTRHLARRLPSTSTLVATDLNPPMLERAQAVGTDGTVEWRAADAMDLPFEDGAFDAVVCQFGVMFYPDRAKAHGEARRVLRPGGGYFFNVWDRLEENAIADLVTQALARAFPDDPPRFLERTPYAYHERARIEQDLAAGGFEANPEIVTLPKTSRARSAHEAALAFCQGSPLRGEIEARGGRLEEVAGAAAVAIARKFGDGPIAAPMQAHVVTVTKEGGGRLAGA